MSERTSLYVNMCHHRCPSKANTRVRVQLDAWVSVHISLRVALGAWGADQFMACPKTKHISFKK